MDLFRTKSTKKQKKEQKNKNKNHSEQIVNSKEITFANIQKDLNDWKIPTVPTNVIYKHGRFSFGINYSVKIVEQVVPLAQESETFQLFQEIQLRIIRKNIASCT